MAFGERAEGMAGMDAFRHVLDNHKWWDAERGLWIGEYTVTQKSRSSGSEEWDEDDSFTIRVESESFDTMSDKLQAETLAHVENIGWDVSKDTSIFKNTER